MSAKLVWITPNAEHVVAYCARVSSPQNQENVATEPKLLRYLIDHKHWSPFEMASACIEIETSRTVSRQILRHSSFRFQEFSGRYSEFDTTKPILPQARRQDLKNRQASHDDLDDGIKAAFTWEAGYLWKIAAEAYHKALRDGIAKECARMLLPEGMTPSRLYMAGTLRSWIHYLEVRDADGVQPEHRAVAQDIKHILVSELPVIAEAVRWVQ